jgi:hypothetical protein
MALNTKSRSEQLQALAAEIVAASGVSLTERAELRPLYRLMAEKSGCHYTTAKQHIAKAMRRARGKLVESGWGGYREGSGRPKENKKQ